MATPTDTERELRSGRWRGLPVPPSLQPVDDPRHADGLRYWQLGVDMALESVRRGTPDGADPDGLAPGREPAEPFTWLPSLQETRPCPCRTPHPSHYRLTVPATYCPGRPG